MAFEGPLMYEVSAESVRSPENASPAAARLLFLPSLLGRKFLAENDATGVPHQRIVPRPPCSRAELDPSVPGKCSFSGQVQVLKRTEGLKHIETH